MRDWPMSDSNFGSAKLRRPFLAWLKQEAARRGTTIYDLVEELVARGGHRPWAAPSTTKRRSGTT
jgi:hypothetical protein